MKKITPFFFLFSFLSIFNGCERNDLPQGENQSGKELSTTSIQKLPSDLIDLSSEDARTVANLFAKRNISTKSFGPKEVRDIVPVYGEEDQTLMYAVNFEDGFILISATTRFYPILAIVEHGSFSVLADSGQEDILDEIKRAIIQSKDVEYAGVNTAWRDYIELSSIDALPTKVGAAYYMLLDDYLMDWHEDDRSVYFLNTQPDNLPDDVYESFCESASLDMPYDYPYMDCAIITEKHITTTTTYGPYLQTLWAQSGNGDGTGIDFNSAVSGYLPLGCVTVAVGQIMRYFEYPPAAYNWSVMPNTTSNTVLSSFLATLRNELQVNNNGGTTYLRAKQTLQDYGYSVDIENHSATNVCSSLTAGRPVYMRGEDSNYSAGHAWVCDGYRNVTGYNEYKLYILRVVNGQPYDFVEWLSARVYDYFGPDLFHMNWGWAGDGNGYFLDGSIAVTRFDESIRNYSNQRKDLLVSVPVSN